VRAIELASFSDPWSPRDFREALEGHTVFLVAAAGNRPVGYVIARAAADEGELLNVAVEPASRGRGIARALVRAALARLARAGVGTVYLEVRESNRPARLLYRGLGFREVGRRPGYYRRPREDAVLLRAELGRPAGDAKL